MNSKLTEWVGIISLCFIAGCASQRNPVPESMMDRATLRGYGVVRGVSSRYSDYLHEDMMSSINDETAGDYPLTSEGRKQYDILAISGGGAHGAYGAGFLYGWSEKDTRPKFKLVTGVSTGALASPFAFLGSEYDEQLKQVYTSITTRDVLDMKGLIGALTSESFAESKPLQKLIERSIDQRILTQVAKEHAKGRRLYVGTTNLDSGELIIWNMGAIAASNRPDSLNVFRKILLASASIPAAFPPVYIDVEAQGRQYDEMHVDGGVKAQFFTYDFALNLDKRNQAGSKEVSAKRGDVYVIRNGKMNPSPKAVEKNLMSIIDRSLGMMINSQSYGDFYRLFILMEKDRFDVYYTALPDDYEDRSKEMFDSKEMKRVFDIGYQIGRSQDSWRTELPGFESQSDVPLQEESQNILSAAGETQSGNSEPPAEKTRTYFTPQR